MPSIDFSYIQNKLIDSDRYNELSKTKEGRKLLLQITSAEIGKFVDNTNIDASDSVAKRWRKNFTDIVRPNKFVTRFTIGSNRLEMTPLLKTVTLPIAQRNLLTFKRCGKTIKLPLNLDNPNSISLTFYHDIDGKVLRNILYTLQQYNYAFADYNDQDSQDQKRFDFSLAYVLSFNHGLKNAETGYVKKFVKDAVASGIEMLGNEVLGSTNFDILNRALLSKNLTNTGNFETVAKVFDYVDDYKLMFTCTYKNCFLENISDLTFDMERINTYQEVSLQLQYKEFEIEVYDWNLKEEGQDLNSSNVINFNSENI